MYKYNIEAAGVSDPCDFPTNNILHNVYNKHARFDENTQSLLGYTGIVNLPCVQLKSFLLAWP